MQNHEEVGAPGYFGPTGQRMACTSHFTKRVGTHVSRTGVTVGRTAVSKRADDFAVVDISALAQSTGLITTNSPNVGDPASRVATFQTGAIKNAIIQYVDEDKFIAKELNLLLRSKVTPILLGAHPPAAQLVSTRVAILKMAQ